MRIKTGWVLLLLISLLSMSLFMSGCSSVAEKASEKAIEKTIEQASGGNAKVDVDSKGNMEIKTEDGSFKTGDTEWPDQLPSDVPRYSDGKIVSVLESSTEDQGTGIFVVIENTSLDAAQSYKEELKKNGWTISMTSNTSDSVMFAATKNNSAITLSFALNEGKSASGGITYSQGK